MSYESRAYDNEHGDPVVVVVASGTHDVSRLTNLLAGSRMALCEHVALSEQILRQVRRHNGGRAALQLLAAHGGPDLLFAADGSAVGEAAVLREAVAAIDRHVDMYEVVARLAVERLVERGATEDEIRHRRRLERRYIRGLLAARDDVEELLAEQAEPSPVSGEAGHVSAGKMPLPDPPAEEVPEIFAETYEAVAE